MVGMSAAFWWALVGIGLMLLEFMMPGLILFFFGIGALFTALLLAFMPLSLTLQLSIFLVASLGSLFALRRYVKQVFSGRKADGEMSEGLAGAEGEVTQAIAPSHPGKIKLNGVDWKAESDEELGPGTIVEVVAQKSLKLKVKSK